jgi:uncharacterized membrane protein
MFGLIVLVLIVLVANYALSAKGKKNTEQLTGVIDKLREEQKFLRREINYLRENIQTLAERGVAATTHAEEPKPIPTKVVEPLPEVAPVIIPVPEVEAPSAIEVPVKEPEVEEVPETIINETPPVHPWAYKEQTLPAQEQHTAPAPPPLPAESWSEKWTRDNPDLEKFIGENLINKIGIAILVLGIAFFVKYAIDQDWINEVGRVCIGLACGGILVGLGHYLRSGYRSFSSVLAGGGIAVFYFTVAFAFHQYHLLPQTAAFIIMVVITAFAVLLAVLYDRLELAVIASVGGFVTPFLISTGSGNYIVLFVYLTILSIGLLLLAWYKRWPAINIISLFFTEIIFGGWLINALSTNKPVSYVYGLVFGTVFYAVYMGMNMLYQIRTRERFRPFDFLILLFISFSYYGAGLAMVRQIDHGLYQGLFTLCVGVLNLGLAYTVYKKSIADRNLLFLLIGLTLTFVTLTIPIQLQGHAITMFWSAEFVLLYWLSVYSGIRVFRYSSIVISGLAMLSLLMDWSNAAMMPGSNHTLIYLDVRGLVTNIIAIAAYGAYYLLLKRSADEEFVKTVSSKQAGRAALLVSVVLLYLTCMFGVNLVFKTQIGMAVPNVYHRITTLLFGLGVLLWFRRRSDWSFGNWVLVPLVVCFLHYLFSAQTINDLRYGAFHNTYATLQMYMHWLSSALLVVLYLLTVKMVRNDLAAYKDRLNFIIVGLCVVAVLLLSQEGMNLYMVVGNQKLPPDVLRGQYGKGGLTVLWGLSSFVMMILGMKHRNKVLRITSLGLFSIVLIKLFIYDISGISEGGKILAFILLGVLLLTVSFMYQKLKRIIFDDVNEQDDKP